MNVLSLFDGISCGQLALKKAGIPVENYYASEIDKHAITIATRNFPSTIHMGDVTKIDNLALTNLPKIDLLIGGSPCQDISVAKKDDRKGLDGEKSKLFFEYLRVLKTLRTKNNDIKFLLENVKGSKKDIDAISEYMGVEPVLINSSTLSAQIRSRYYWTNIEGVIPPIDKGLTLQSVLEHGYTEKEKAYCITATYSGACVQSYFIRSERQMIFKQPIKVTAENGVKLYEVGGEVIRICPRKDVAYNRVELDRLKPYTRLLTPVECERLQTLPDNYTDGIPKTQRYKAVGNGWTVDVIAHIFTSLRGAVT